MWITEERATFLSILESPENKVCPFSTEFRRLITLKTTAKT